MKKIYIGVAACLLFGVSYAKAATPIIYYSFDSSSTLTQIDQSGNGNDANPVGLPVYSSLIPPVTIPDTGSLYFNGGTNALMVSSNSTSSVIQSTWAVSFWFMAPNLNTLQTLVGSRQPDPYSFTLFVSSNFIHVNFGDGEKYLNSIYNFPYSFNVGQWYHVFVQASSYGESTYVNGVLVGSEAFLGNPVLKDANHWLYLGSKPVGAGTPFTGYIDEFRVFNTLIDPHDIAMLAQTTGTNLIPPQTTYILTQNQMNDIKEQIYVNVFKNIVELPDSYFTGVSTNPALNAVPVYPLMIPNSTGTASGEYCYTVSTASYNSWNDLFKLNVINGIVSKSFDDVSWPNTFFMSLQDVEDQ